MKILKLPKSYTASAFNGHANIDVSLLPELFGPIETNKARILEITNDIERVMNTIIKYHFFQGIIELKNQAKEFLDQILNSDWCTFSSKKKLLKHIIESKNYLEGKKKSEFDSLLKKVMSYRNAFAHGEFETNGREVRLKYFEGTNIIKDLTDEYFEQVEKNIIACWQILQEVSTKSEAQKPHVKPIN